MTEQPVSKVLVLDDHPECQGAIKQLCDAHHLVGLKVRKNRLMAVLRSNIDLGAILLAEDYGGSAMASAEIALQINTVRPELPIILRRTSVPTLDDVPEMLRRVCCAAYTLQDTSPLQRAIDEYIFSVVYPNALVRGISEITQNVLAAQFKTLTPRWHTPYIVRDRIIFGEVFSLIPLESSWCRGYMMLQTEEAAVLEALNADRHVPDADFREVNSLLGEITNLIWGAFKNRYIGDVGATCCHPIQVPIIVNHRQKYISFGSENPQLCFRYTLTDERSGAEIKLYQRFVFNLSWSPEDFREIAHDSSELVASGELELF
ncbi:chemotaxis protein CheX [Propionivibrio limicola]|uniref:chemotaxis protein CheX n=1 Tax=Propionivibrio limicola TaxID=167645 RepID=UPI00129231E7|nr:chemotaxis protein CheX [Propionivibrio limicola]